MQGNNAGFSLFNGKGVKVFFTLEINPGAFADELQVIDSAIDTALANGYTVNVAGATAGEHVEDVGLVSRREKGDGTIAIDIYSPNARVSKKVFTHYLDTPEMRTDFERNTGLLVDTLPLWDGEHAITKEAKNAAKYIIPVKKPAKIALTENPAHDPTDDVKKFKPQYLFARWLPSADAPLAVVPKAPSSSSASSPASPGASVERIEVTGDVSDAIDAAFGKREPNTIVVSEIKVVRSGGNSRMLLFESGDVTVSAFTRDKLRGVLPDPLLEQIATPGRYAVPSMKITYELDGGHNRLAKAELVA